MYRRRPRIRRGVQDEFETKLLDLARVSHTREGGKKLRFRALMIVGDKKGRVGMGVSSGIDVAKAIAKSTRAAKKSLIKVPILNETIPHEIVAKFGAAKIMLKPQRKGRGLVAGGTVRTICMLAGIKNISSKVLGSTRNKLNNAKATLKALKQLKKVTVSEEKKVEEKEIVKNEEPKEGSKDKKENLEKHETKPD